MKVLKSCYFIVVLLFAVLFTGCDSEDDWIYGTREVYYITNCNASINLRQSASTKSKVVGKCDRNSIIKQADAFGDDWYKIILDTGESGYVSSKFVGSKVEKYPIRRKTDRDDLVEANQSLIVSLIDGFDSVPRAQCPVWTIVVASLLTILCGVFWFMHLEGQDGDPVWIAYLLTIANGLLLGYMAFSYDMMNMDAWDPGWLVGILLIIGYLIAVFVLWFVLVAGTRILLANSTLASTHGYGNVLAIIVVMACGYWFEAWADMTLVFAVLWNIVFGVIYLVVGIKRRNFVGFLAVLILWGVCLVPTVIYTFWALRMIFMLACIFFFLGAFASGGGRSSGGSHQYDRTVTDSSGRVIDRIDRDGNSEYGGRKYRDDGTREY